MFDTVHTPTHPELVPSFPIDTDDWTNAQWKAYHQKLKVKYGAAYATQTFNIDWDNQGWFPTSNYPSNVYDCAWYNYAKANGLNYHGGADVAVWCGVGGAVGGAGDAAGNVGDGAAFLSGLIKPVAIVALIGGGVYAYNRYIKPKRGRR